MCKGGVMLKNKCIKLVLALAGTVAVVAVMVLT